MQEAAAWYSKFARLVAKPQSRGRDEESTIGLGRETVSEPGDSTSTEGEEVEL